MELKKETQVHMVEMQLRGCSFVSRNWALRNYISRLSAIIFILKLKYGKNNIVGRSVKTTAGRDYIYELKGF